MSLFVAKAKADKLPVKKTKKERQWYTAAGVLTTQLLNTLRKPSKMVKQTKPKKKLKHKNSSPIIFVKLVIPADKKSRQSKTRLVKSLVDSGASESILR